jgi:hypothetical protein
MVTFAWNRSPALMAYWGTLNSTDLFLLARDRAERPPPERVRLAAGMREVLSDSSATVAGFQVMIGYLACQWPRNPTR